MRRIAWIALFALTACLPSAPERTGYTLTPQVEQAEARHGRGPHHYITVRVLMPEGEHGLASNRIAITSGGQASSIENAAWSEPLAKMLQTNMIEALRGSGAFAEAVDDYSPVGSQLAIQTQIQRFTLVTGGGSHVEVALRVDFLHPGDHRLIKSLALAEQEPVAQVRMREVVPAFNRALARCLEQVTAQAARLR